MTPLNLCVCLELKSKLKQIIIANSLKPFNRSRISYNISNITLYLKWTLLYRTALLYRTTLLILCNFCETGLACEHGIILQRRCSDIKVWLLLKSSDNQSIMCFRLSSIFDYDFCPLPIANAWQCHLYCAALSSNVGASVHLFSLKCSLIRFRDCNGIFW